MSIFKPNGQYLGHKTRTFTYHGRTTIVVFKNGKRIGIIAHVHGIEGWTWKRMTFMAKEHGVGVSVSKKEAFENVLKMHESKKKSDRTRKANNKCLCREPKRHRDCMFCGIGFSDRICGVCHEAGIDGKCIPGTARVVCRLHKG